MENNTTMSVQKEYASQINRLPLILARKIVNIDKDNRRNLNHEYGILFLKVGGNEKQWESGRSQMLGNGLGPWRSRFIYNLKTELLNKIHISFSALKMNKQLL
jgi:hypothetical protein